jgi:hypothetical protein
LPAVTVLVACDHLPDTLLAMPRNTTSAPRSCRPSKPRPTRPDAVPGPDGQVAVDAFIGGFARHHRCEQPGDAELLERIGRVEGDALVNLVRAGAVPPGDILPVSLTLLSASQSSARATGVATATGHLGTSLATERS